MKQLTRTTEDRKLAGVCGGIGEYFSIDPTVVRIGVIILAIPFSLLVIALYIIGIFLMPNDTDTDVEES